MTLAGLEAGLIPAPGSREQAGVRSQLESILGAQRAGLELISHREGTVKVVTFGNRLASHWPQHQGGHLGHPAPSPAAWKRLEGEGRRWGAVWWGGPSSGWEVHGPGFQPQLSHLPGSGDLGLVPDLLSITLPSTKSD